jgi:hypothetical protein
MLKTLAICFLVLFSVFVLYPGYADFCDAAKGHEYYCGVHKAIVALGTWVKHKENAITAAATIAIAFFTLTLWVSTGLAENHTRVTERAYVKLSHHTPGVIFTREHFVIQISIKNFGRTPARVEDTVIRPILLHRGESLPRVPEYNRAVSPREKVFLVAEDEVFAPNTFPISDESAKAIKSGDVVLYVIGYVDYVDVFGARHRGGYGRVYDPAVDAGTPAQERSNLLYFPAENYNYDRRLRRWCAFCRYFS